MLKLELHKPINIFLCRRVDKRIDPIIGIYKITSPTGKINIGKATDIENRLCHYKSYTCKNQPKLFSSLKKHGVENHVFEIIHLCKEEELNYLEYYYVKNFDTFNTPHGLNLKEGGGNSVKLSDESRKKISDSQKGKSRPPKSEETRKKISESQKGKIISKEHKARISQAHKDGKYKYEKISDNARIKIGNAHRGKLVSKETREKISKANKGKTASDETKKKMSDSRKGKIVSEETKKRMSDSNKGKFLGESRWNYGVKHTEETKKKIGDKHRGKTISEEHKERLRVVNLGKKASEETKLKISKGNKGKILSEETKLKISNSHKGKKRVIIDGKTKYIKK